MDTVFEIISTIWAARAPIILVWLLTLSFIYTYRILELFHISHAYITVIPAYIALSFSDGKNSTWILFVVGLFCSALIAYILERYIYEKVKLELRCGVRGVLIALAIFYMADYILGFFGIPEESVAVPNDISLGSENTNGSIHTISAVSGVLFYFGFAYWIYKSYFGLRVRAIVSSPIASKLIGIPIERLRRISIIIATVVGSMAVLGFAGTTSLEPRIALSGGLLGILVYLITPRHWVLLADLLVLILIITRWIVARVAPSYLVFSQEGLLLLMLICAIVVNARKRPGQRKADDPKDVSLSFERRCQNSKHVTGRYRSGI